MKEFEGNIVDVVGGEIFPGVLEIEEDRVTRIKRSSDGGSGARDYILPGFVDAHIHIESTMLTPSQFARAVVPHGTVAVVADPHEIANVVGMEGIEFMRRDATLAPLKVFFTAPSCVPATPFETNGATIGLKEIDELLSIDDVVALGEVMDYLGVVRGNQELMEKIAIAKKHGKPVDGHCPGLRGEGLGRYADAGISTDHESTTLEEAEEKASLGMKIMIREGSSAKNLEALAKLSGEGFLVSDDKHIEDLLEQGHLDTALAKAVRLGMDPMRAIRMATLNPVKHYGLRVGLLQAGDPADFLVVDGLDSFRVKEVWIAGKRVAVEGVSLFTVEPAGVVNAFRVAQKKPEDFRLRANAGPVRARVIKVMEGSILTKASVALLTVRDGSVLTNPEKDILKLAAVERYAGTGVAVSFVKGFGFKKGALASSIAHDSHNIIAVGSDDWNLAIAVNVIAMMKGGLAAVYDGKVLDSMSLPVGGLMSNEAPETVARKLKNLHRAAKAMGCKLSSPFMSLSFLSLLVIPELRLSDRGLFDVGEFRFVEPFTSA